MKMKCLLPAVVLGMTGSLFAAEPAARATVSVDLAAEKGPIRLMNAVNNGPTVSKPGGDQVLGNFEDYRALKIPFARTHDSIGCCPGGAHTCDIQAVFPDFEKDENDPKNYDFVFTDHYLDTMRRAGTEVFFRLGQTIEHGPKKYGVIPPSDFAKWARVCEHVVRHYNEGWGWGLDKHPTTVNIAWSNQFNIVYWEIWNEPDLDSWGAQDAEGRAINPRCWYGTETNFFNLYETAAKHLKAKFPKLKIGGPGLCGNDDWDARFIRYCRDTKTPLDFHSWHCYATETRRMPDKCFKVRKLLDDNGFGKTESILNEWNTVKGWTDDYRYAMETICGRLNQKGAAFIASVMIECQKAPLDMLMYYDARHTTVFNGMFDRVSLLPLKGYYPFLAWSHLRDLYPTEVACTLEEGHGTASDAATAVVHDKAGEAKSGQFFALAAKGAGGRGAVMIARYSSDDNCSDTAKVTVLVPGADLARARCHLTDSVRTYTEAPLEDVKPGSAVLRMQPNSFAFIEF